MFAGNGFKGQNPMDDIVIQDKVQIQAL